MWKVSKVAQAAQTATKNPEAAQGSDEAEIVDIRSTLSSMISLREEGDTTAELPKSYQLAVSHHLTITPPQSGYCDSVASHGLMVLSCPVTKTLFVYCTTTGILKHTYVFNGFR